MGIKIIPLSEPISFEKFIDKYQIDVEVRERSRDDKLPRWYAGFKGTEISYGAILISPYGDGNTPKEAIEDLARRILGKRLVNACTGARREFNAPNEWSK